MNGTIALTLTIALPLLISPVIYLVGRLESRRGAKRNPAGWLALLGLLAAAVMDYFAFQAYRSGGVEAVSRTVGDVLLQMDGIGLLLSAVALVLGILVTLFSIPYMAGEEGEEKFYALLTAMIGTIIGLGCTTDLFNLWVWFEAMAITSYMLVAFYRNQPGSLEAGVKYLVQSATGSVLVLLGIALVLAETGSLDLAVIRDTAGNGSGLLLAAGALFLIGFGVKAALVPMHTWLPDAHSQAPSGISAMLSGIVIEAGLVALLRSVGAVSASSAAWGPLLLGFGALNMLVGNLMALRQKQVKRLLAYSSLSHMGYMLLGIGFAVAYGAVNGAGGALFHLITHGLMKGLAFLAAGALLYALYIARGHHGALMVDDLNGAAGRYPLAALALSAAVLGLGGLPPLAGFMSKWQIFAAGAETGRTAALLLVIFAALNSVLSLGYYAPLVNRMFRLKPSAAVEQGAKTSLLIRLPLVVLILAVVVLGVWPTLLSDWTAQAAQSLLLAFGG